MGIEDIQYRVYTEQRPKETLHTGSIWECERWISANGVVGTSYIIDRVKAEKPKKSKPLF